MRVNRLVLLNGSAGKCGVSALKRLDGLAEHLLGEATHLGDPVVEGGELFLIGGNDVFMRVHLDTVSSNALSDQTC